MPRSLLWPDPRVKPPFGAAEIDWGHPLAQGLEGLWLFNEGGGVIVYDLVGRTPLVIGAALPGWETGRDGYTLRREWSQSGPKSLADTQGLTSALTVACKWAPSINQNAGSLVSKQQRYGSQHSYALTPYNNTQNGFYIWVAGVMKKAEGTTSFLLSRNTWWGRFDGSNVLANVYDFTGKSLESITGDATTGPIDTSTAKFCVGNADDNTAPTGSIDHGAIWSGALSTQYLAWFSAEPYAMLRPIIRRRYSIPHKIGPLIHAGNPQLITTGGSIGGATL